MKSSEQFLTIIRGARRLIRRILPVLSRSFRLGFILYILLALSFANSWQAWLLPEWHVPVAHAAYTGKQLRTVEFVMGGGGGNSTSTNGTDTQLNGTRASDTNLYAGTSWNTTKSTAGTKTVAIPGTGIHVLSAYVEFSALPVSAADVTDIELALDVNPGPWAGHDYTIDPTTRTGTRNIYLQNSGLASPRIFARADATALFQSPTDSQFNSGLSVVAMASITGPTWEFATMKLIVTYEQDYSAAAHTELKTVRFPLRSSTAGDNGTKQANCAAASTCGFTYTTFLPDLATTSNIADVWFDISYIEDGSATVTPQISGGAGGVQFTPKEATTNNADRSILLRPQAGGTGGFATGTQTLNITVAGTAVSALGGELVITYSYSTGATQQVETVQYYLNQDQTLPGTASTTFSQNISVANGGRIISNVWEELHTSVTGTQTLMASSTIGTGTPVTAGYVLTAANDRSGEARIVHDFGSATSSFNQATSTIYGALNYSSATGDSVTSVEVFVTFLWSGSSGGVVTKTGKFFVGNTNSPENATLPDNFGWGVPSMAPVTLPETVTKISRTAYVHATMAHTKTTSITVNAVRFDFGGPRVIVETDVDSEDYAASYLIVATTSISGIATGTPITWTTRNFYFNFAGNTVNDSYTYSADMVVTYEAHFEEDSATTLKHLRTVEFIMGGTGGSATSSTGIDATGNQASQNDLFVGSVWSTVSVAAAGTKTITIPGSGIQVVSAYVETAFSPSTSGSTTDVELGFSASPGPPGGYVGLIHLDSITRSTASHFYVETSGISPAHQVIRANATGLFQSQTDSDWNTGVATVGHLSVQGPSWNIATMKLIITYMQTDNPVAHTELKTVRFPLRSTTAGDNGTKQANCGAGTTCGFSYTTSLPDLATTSDIMDIWFDVSYLDDAAAKVRPEISGGSTGIVEAPADATTDNLEHDISYRPPIGTPGFATGTQTLNIVTTGAISALGGELVITYKYSTGATQQVETTQYFLDQEQALPGTASTTFSQNASIANGGRQILNVWEKIHVSPTATVTLFASSTIGTGTPVIDSYTLTAANPRTGETTIIHDFGSATTSFNQATSTITTALNFSANTADSVSAVEAYVTFIWSGAAAGPVTKTVKFFGGNSGEAQTATLEQSAPFMVVLPETSIKISRAAYLRSTVIHSFTTTITAGTIRMSLGGDTIVPTEATEDVETYGATYFLAATTSSSGIATGTPIAWTSRGFINTVVGNQSENYTQTADMVITYEVQYPPPNLTFYHFLWRNDDSDETGASSAAAQDVSLTNLYVGDRYRLRILVDNQGSGSASNIAYRLESASSSCTAWMAVPSDTGFTTEHWKIDLSQYIPDGTASTDNGSLTNPSSKTFVAGEVRTSANQSSANSMTTAQFTELEYSLRSTQYITLGTTYCFRLTNAGDATNFTYTAQPQATLLYSLHPTGGGSPVESVGSGTLQTGGVSGGGSGSESGGGGSGHTGGGAGGGGDSG